MILIIDLCKNKLHSKEFVEPIEQICDFEKAHYKTVHYTEIGPSDLAYSSKIILCGTSLKDFDYEAHLQKFDFIKHYNKPLLGICAGMQILAMLDGAKLKKGLAIGLHEVTFQDFLGIKATKEVYELHNMIISKPESYEVKATNSKKHIQAIQHKEKPFYGILSHPEVRNKEIIVNFLGSIR